MDKNKNRKASGLGALLSRQHSIMLIDAKGELTALIRGKAEENGDSGVLTINPFVLLPPEETEKCGKWFRLCVKTTIADLIKG